ncbi:hypothetical protein MPTK1_1g11810 [Marchantia polymorpha subsp. ruderalis]|uniref:Late embryogenesis abundant protein LEA-2 subgroup domain-containing protein n=2 Tax=Marchantia polymorpha TaxID=3197 RepID=A0AAF6AP51_MARPO|nr:hypothetical protein MARPO_0014s0046 [Marchantia polymorpha]BBM98221.1 hypothetical protein Mp_1g11810 [Marchantia polymorpha subsp. ruderalis]|eukprot:PTQ45499.1 hypothetical protein MARPO_0014s0046 [Marchantia polymorpha]
MAAVVLSTVFVLLAALVSKTGAWSVSCSNPYSQCYGQLQTCPANCAQWCEVDCTTCNVQCACDKPGAVCQDPRFIGGDGVMFYFHGEKDKDFCIVSDPALHINAHFIGKRGSGMTRDFTWVQSLGIMFGSRTLYIGAQTVGTWDNHVDALSLSFDGQPLLLPPRVNATLEFPDAGLQIVRVEGKNAVTVEVKGSFKLEAHVVPITKQESRIHNYDITAENCFAHLELNFQFFNLSTEVNGILGQTYVPGYKSPVKVGVPMPIMGGDESYVSSALFQTDCAVSKFGATPSGQTIRQAASASCGNARSGGLVCRR